MSTQIPAIGDLRSVGNMPNSFTFVSDSQDVAAVYDSIGASTETREDYDSLFCEVLDGEYGAIYGMCGIVPYTSKLVCRIH